MGKSLMKQRIAVWGATGRVGQALIEACSLTEDLEVSGAFARVNSPKVGQLIPHTKTHYSSDPQTVLHTADVVIDFSNPEGLQALLQALSPMPERRALVTGTTGLSPELFEQLKCYSQQCVAVQAPNMSLGVTLLNSLVAQAARILSDAAFDIEILEFHHRHKIDAPSGTSLGLARAMAKARNVSDQSSIVCDRGIRPGPRQKGEIGIAVLRGGGIGSDHQVLFAGENETLTLAHHTADRSVFAHGAFHAARWARAQPPGLYSMADVLGIAS